MENEVLLMFLIKHFKMFQILMKSSITHFLVKVLSFSFGVPIGRRSEFWNG